MLQNHLVSTILKHDAKVTSYKIALLRAINDVALSFPNVNPGERAVAVPLRVLAECWIAYYWPFVDEAAPVLQGPLSKRAAGPANDVAFQPALTQLRRAWEQAIGAAAQPADGLYLVNELRVPRRRKSYAADFFRLYERTLKTIARSLLMPIRYAGPQEWTVFERPQRWSELQGRGQSNIVAVPTTGPEDLCLVIEGELWQSFRELSLWIEALAIHEWCLFAERVQPDTSVGRGHVYELLTDRPDNRRPFTWERNNIDLLLMEGRHFVCPWTQKAITQRSQYAVDHLIPLSVYPINELWNLVPSDAHFNSHVKGNRLPSVQRLAVAQPFLVSAYENYQRSKPLQQAMHDDAKVRFSRLEEERADFPQSLAEAVMHLMQFIQSSRNLRQF